MKFRSTWRRVAFTMVAILALTALGPALPAGASNYSGQTGATGCNALNEADNEAHNFHYVDLNADMTAATNWARTNVLDPTAINTSYDSTLDELTDVVVRDRYYVDYCGFAWYPDSGGIVGLATCDSLSPSGQCEQHTARYNNNWTDTTTLNNRRGLACHELGHTLGLAHPPAGADYADNTCMHQGYPKEALHYDPDHERNGHIANNYP